MPRNMRRRSFGQARCSNAGKARQRPPHLRGSGNRCRCKKSASHWSHTPRTLDTHRRHRRTGSGAVRNSSTTPRIHLYHWRFPPPSLKPVPHQETPGESKRVLARSRFWGTGKARTMRLRRHPARRDRRSQPPRKARTGSLGHHAIEQENPLAKSAPPAPQGWRHARHRARLHRLA